MSIRGRLKIYGVLLCPPCAIFSGYWSRRALAPAVVALSARPLLRTVRGPTRRYHVGGGHGPGPSCASWALMTTYHTYPSSRGSRKMGWTRANDPVFCTIVSTILVIDVVTFLGCWMLHDECLWPSHFWN